jgi:hypothetical protein
LVMLIPAVLWALAMRVGMERTAEISIESER